MQLLWDGLEVEDKDLNKVFLKLAPSTGPF